ncbi:P1 family peptidase [Ileibacterium valens]|uniref:P1 family peptidase n=1 Tax=Ileibacterium valens TaxID=1862668 RepID=UPI0023553165|nr:P1 family peptidase [Ileibacterium valens]
MKKINFTEIAGFQSGQATDTENGTGVTIILSPAGATAGVDVRGGGPATRETDLLDPKNMVQKINAVTLSGGSAFGLEASSGVMQYCREKGYGFGLKEFVVPIVCQASLFDLGCGSSLAYPTREMGYQACLDSENNHVKSGNYGAGTGASVGKALGFDKAMKTGQGTCAFEIDNLQVGAIVAVNACGDVFEPNSTNRLAGIYDPATNSEINTEEAILALASSAINSTSENTTIACIITNADLDQAQMTKLAGMAQDALARTIRPVHTPNDGDTVFTMTSNQVKAPLDVVALMAIRALENAIIDAVVSAQDAYGLPCSNTVLANRQK